MKNKKKFGKVLVVGIFTLLCMIIFVNACTIQPTTISPTDEIIQKTAISPVSTTTPVHTTFPSPTATQDNKVELIRNASESISNFTIYDDFSETFDESKWEITASTEPNSFTYFTEDGELKIHFKDMLYKNVESILLEVNPEVFSENTNGVSVQLGPTEIREQSHFGLQIAIMDDQQRWTYRVDWNLAYPEIICDLSNSANDTVLNKSDRSFSTQYSLEAGVKIDVEWLPESGLLMTFIDNQLFDSVQLPVSGQLKIEGAGLFVKRTGLSKGGNLSFSDFRIGSYQDTGLTLPDDLLNQQERPFQFSERGIDYYLLDDFEDPMFDGKIDRSRWTVDFFFCVENPDYCNDKIGKIYQENGKLTLSGDFNGLTVKARAHDLRALQFDVAGNDETLPGTVIVAHYFFGRNPNIGRDTGEVLFEFNCEVIIGDQGVGLIDCVYLDPHRAEAHISQVSLLRFDSNTINMAFNDTLRAFELRVNGVLVGQLPVTQDDLSWINELYTTFSIEEYWDIHSNQIRLDNFLVGYQSEKVWAEPETESPEITDTLPHSDLFLYDDFDDQQFDGAWNINKWPFSRISGEGGFWQENGVLVSSSFLPPGKLSTARLSSERTMISQEENFNAIQIEIAPLEEPFGEHSEISVAASQLLPDLKKKDGGDYDCDGCKIMEFVCSIHFLGDHEELMCGPKQQTYDFSQPMRTIMIVQNIDSSRSHFLSLELDRETRTYYVYLDDEMVASYQVPSDYLLGEQNFLLIPYYPAGEDAAVVQVDNIFLGREAEHPELVSKWKTDQYSVINNLANGEEFISLPNAGEITFMLTANLRDEFKLSEFNSISYTLQPIDDAPLGWSSNLIFNNVGEDELRYGCMVMFDEEPNSHIHCDLFVDGTPVPAHSSDIPFDPKVEHTIAMEVHPKTRSIILIWDGESVFEVDISKPAEYFENNTFRFNMHVSPLSPEAEDFQINIKDFWFGLRY